MDDAAPAIRDRIKEFRRVPASDLRPNPANWRTHGDEQRAALAGVLSEIGIAGAVIARECDDGSLELIDGHLRAETLPDALVPVLVLDVTEAEADKLLVTLDPLAALAGTDGAKLSALLDQVDSESAAVTRLLADLAEQAVAALPVVQSDVDAEPQIDRAEELRKKWGVESAQLWQLGEHRLLCGDSTKPEDVARVMGGELWRLCVTSPPYNQDIGNFSKSGMHKETKWVDQTRAGAYEDNKPEDEYREWQRLSVSVWCTQATTDASLFYNHKNRFRDKQCISPWLWLQSLSLKMRQEIIWYREGSVTQNMRGFMPCDERIFWLYIGDDFYFDDSTEHKTWSTVWKINSHKDRGQSMHGCQFPVELPSRAIRACSEPDDFVFEPYSGSGTTIIACEQLNRRCRAIEISPAYCAVILQRFLDATGKTPVLIESR